MFRRRSSATTAARMMVLKNGPWGPFMSCPDYSRRSAVQDDPQADAEGAAEAAGATRRGVPEVRQAAAAARRAVWRVHRMQRVSEVQVREAGVAGCAVPEGRRRHRGAEDEARRHVLWLRELSEVRLRLEPEAGEPDLSEVRQRVPAGVLEQGGDVPGVPEQPGVPAEAAAEEGCEGRGADHASVQLRAAYWRPEASGGDRVA